MNHREIYLDVTIVHTTTPYRLGQKAWTPTLHDPRIPHKKKEADKNRLYLASCRAAHAEFLPLVFDTYGGFSDITRRFLEDVANITMWPTAESQRWDITRIVNAISCAIQRGNGITMRQGIQASRDGAILTSGQCPPLPAQWHAVDIAPIVAALRPALGSALALAQ
jgi:hypothetical protein